MDIIDEKLKCYICGNMDSGSIKGIILLGKYICRECELDLTVIPIDGAEYEKFKGGIRDIWGDFK